jgi:hypothetical protein
VLTIAIIGPALVLVPERGLDGAAEAFLGGNIVAALVAVAIHLSGRTSWTETVDRASAAELEADTIGLAPLG